MDYILKGIVIFFYNTYYNVKDDNYSSIKGEIEQ